MSKKILLISCMAMFLAGPVAAQPTMIALSGTAAAAGGNFSSFGFPLLSGSGQVAFSAGLTGGSSTEGIFAGTPGSLQAAALLGTAAPAGGNYSVFRPPVLNGAGQVAFRATLTGGSSSQGLFAGVPGSLQTVALSSTAAPVGGNYIAMGDPVLNGAGRVAFVALLTSGSSPEAIFTGAPGSLQTAALAGTAAPAGGNYSSFSSFVGPVINGSGQVAFAATLTGGSSTQGIFVGAPGAVQAAALTNTAAPAGGNYSGFVTSVLNGAGQVAFQASLTGGSSTRGIFAGAPGAVQATALQGTAAPAGGNYVSFFNPVLNGAGQVAFRADLTGGSSSRGLFAGAPGAIQTVALLGAAAPRGGNYSSLSDAAINGLGQVVFLSDLDANVNARGLFAGMPGNLSAIVLHGDVIDIDPGPGVDNRTVNSINIGGVSGGQDGRSMTFNDDGLIVYRLGFTDGSQGVFTSVVAVPEPSSLLLLATAVLAAGGWMMRRRRPDQVA